MNLFIYLILVNMNLYIITFDKIKNL